MQKFQCIALTPPGIIDPSIAIAACRTGELGVLDLEYAKDLDGALEAVRKLARYARRSCGIKINVSAGGLLPQLIPDLPEIVQVIILTQSSQDDLKQTVRSLHDRNLTVLLEITCLDEALSGVEAKVDGLIAKGSEAGGRVGEESAFVRQRFFFRVHP